MNVRCLILLSLGLAVSGARAADPKSPAPAQVANAVKETELTTLKLTPHAAQRLGITLVAAARKKVAVTRWFGGELLVPLAPAGESPTGYFPLATATPDELLKIADQQAVAEGEMAKAQIQLDAAQRIHQRAQKLIQGEAGSVRAAEEAQTQVRLAEQTLAVARSRRALLGAPLADAIRRQRLWVRVPVYAGELPLLDATLEARIGGGAARPGDPTFPAKPVPAPPSANPVTATVDLFYEIETAGSALRPGQRVSVSVPVRGEADSLVVPWAAILHDIHGNTWVYESLAPQTFTRRRVQVVRIVGAEAVLASGPPPGTPVVTAGAAELFGTEFGTK